MITEYTERWGDYQPGQSTSLPFRTRYLARANTERNVAIATRPPGYRRTSTFVRFRVHCRIVFRQPHLPLPSRFCRTSNFAPFCVHGSIYFCDDYTYVQSNTMYIDFYIFKSDTQAGVDSSYPIPFSIHFSAGGDPFSGVTFPFQSSLFPV